MSTPHPQSDSEVLKDSIKNPWMFGTLVERYQKAFLRKASYMLHSNEIAEDAVQDTFLKIYKNAGKFEERRGATFNSWAYKILTNTCLTYAKKWSVESAKIKIQEFADLDVSGSVDQNPNNDNHSLVHSVLVRLPEKFSRLLSLYFFEERSYEEIAEIEAVSLSAVKSSLHRAKKQFKNIALEIK